MSGFRPKLVDPKRDQRIMAAYAEGLSLTAIGERFGLCERAVNTLLRRNGAPRRRQDKAPAKQPATLAR